MQIIDIFQWIGIFTILGGGLIYIYVKMKSEDE
jgi:hypothetical protein